MPSSWFIVSLFAFLFVWGFQLFKICFTEKVDKVETKATMLIIWPPDDHGVITTTPSPKPQNETKERRRPRNRRPRPSPGQSRSRPPGQRRPISPLDPTKHRHPGPRTINRRSDRIGAGGFGNNRRIGRKTLFNAEDSTIESEVLRGHRAEGGGRRQRRSHLHVSSQEWSLVHIFAHITIDFAVYDWYGR